MVKKNKLKSPFNQYFSIATTGKIILKLYYKKMEEKN